MALYVHFYKKSGAGNVVWAINATASPSTEAAIGLPQLSDDELAALPATSYPDLRSFITSESAKASPSLAAQPATVVSASLDPKAEADATAWIKAKPSVVVPVAAVLPAAAAAAGVGGAGAGIRMPAVADLAMELNEEIYRTAGGTFALTMPKRGGCFFQEETVYGTAETLFIQLGDRRSRLINKQNYCASLLFVTQALLATSIAVLQIVKITINGAYDDNNKLASKHANLGIDITTLVLPLIFALFSLFVDYVRTGAKNHSASLSREMKKIRSLAKVIEVTELTAALTPEELAAAADRSKKLALAAAEEAKAVAAMTKAQKEAVEAANALVGVVSPASTGSCKC